MNWALGGNEGIDNSELRVSGLRMEKKMVYLGVAQGLLSRSFLYSVLATKKSVDENSVI